MSKRIRMPDQYEERRHRKRRCKCTRSPSTGRDYDLEIEKQIFNLKMELDILRAQVTLLRKKLQDLQQPPSGQKDDTNICIFM